MGHAEIPEHHSLASRDLRRGAALGLPSGEAVARRMGVESLTPEECGLGAGWASETPLWYYVFEKAEGRAGGEHLGPVGGRIFAEVLFGTIEADPGSCRRAEPGWRPELPPDEPGDSKTADLLGFVGASSPEEAAR